MKMMICAIILTIVNLVCGYKPIEAYYPTVGIVCEVDKAANVVAVKDNNGNVWEFSGTEDWIRGDICAMLMYDNGTEIIYDDIIIDVRYCGYIY